MQLGEIEDSLMEKWKAITGHSLLNFRFNKPVDRVAIYCPGRAGRIRVKSSWPVSPSLRTSWDTCPPRDPSAGLKDYDSQRSLN